MKKQWKLQPADPEKVAALQEALKVHPVFCQLLVQRGLLTYEAARQFFRPKWEDLHDPFLMKDMDKAVRRLADAIREKERIMLYGDYDIDGTTSVALMYSFLAKYHRDMGFYIPDRYKEGYGLSFDGVEFAASKGVKLMIVMDCGIKAEKAVNFANSYGIDVIICDHHLPDENIPDAVAVLDPKREDCEYPYKELSGCGITFKLVQGFSQQFDLPKEDLEKLLDFLVISIAGDIVPITQENRVLAHFGLQQLNQTKRLGIRAMILESERQMPLTISDIVFGIGPHINAAGRLADAHQAVKVLLSNQKTAAMENAAILAQRNKMRREFDQRIAEEAKTMFKEMEDREERKSIVLYQPHWHKGVVGIAASRVVEEFYRPTIILTESNGLAVGSARSVKGFNIHAAIQQCEDLLINFGGHHHAAGLTLLPHNVEAFQDRFEAIVSTYIEEELLQPVLTISAVLKLKDITPNFFDVLKAFAPFGPSNRNPVFVSQHVKDAGYSRILKNKHLKMTIKQGNSEVFNAIAFNRAEDYENVISKKPFHIAYTIEENKWKDKSYLQLMVKDMKFS